MPLQARLVLAARLPGEPWHDPFVHLAELDVTQLLVQATYFFTGDLPDEVWRANGEPITPLHGKVRDFEFYGRTLLRQRIVWLPSNRSLQLDLGGSAADIVYERPHGPVHVAPPGQIRWWLNPASARASKTILGPLLPVTPKSKKGRTAKALAHTRQVRKKYADAWVLMDRVHDAADSGEILFRHLREHHPDINAWFVLEKGGKEWDRFKAEGHGDRLVAFGSMQWRLLLANAAHLLSSHADAADRRSPGDPRVHPPALAVPLPPARRDQGRPLGLAGSQEARHVRGQHPPGDGVDRRRPHAVRLHLARGGAHRPAPVRPAP